MNRDPSLAAELAASKRHQAEANRLAREAAAPAIQTAEIDTSMTSEPRPDGAPAKCSFCEGTGMVGGLFSKYGCGVCEETGYDLSDPVAVIKHLLAGGRKLRQQFQAHQRETKVLRELIGEEEIKRRQEEAWVEKHHSRFD